MTITICWRDGPDVPWAASAKNDNFKVNYIPSYATSRGHPLYLVQFTNREVPRFTLALTVSAETLRIVSEQAPQFGPPQSTPSSFPF
jgi:hypothetical protein